MPMQFELHFEGEQRQTAILCIAEAQRIWNFEMCMYKFSGTT